jgi:hypothetical protein
MIQDQEFRIFILMFVKWLKDSSVFSLCQRTKWDKNYGAL